MYDVVQIRILFKYILFVNFAFYHCAIASMFDSSIFTHKSPAFSFQKLNRSGASVWDDIELN